MIVAEALLIVVVEKVGFTIRKLLVYLTNNTITAKEKIIDVNTTVDVAELHPSSSQSLHELPLSLQKSFSVVQPLDSVPFTVKEKYLCN